MSATPLLAQVRREAGDAVERTLAAARDEVARLDAESEARLAGQRRDALAQQATALGAELARARHGRERARRLTVLGARRRLVERALARARERAWDLDRAPGTTRALERLLTQALAYLPGDGRVVRRHPRLGATLDAAVRAAGAEARDDDAAGFGFVVESQDGRSRVDVSIDGLLARAHGSLAIALVRDHAGGRP